MKWFDSIPLKRPLRDVRLLTQSPAQDWNEHLREREQAAYERGRQDGENALREQLIGQRNEIGALLNGVIESLRKVAPQVVHETETAVIQLAFESAQKVVAGMPIDQELVSAVVREALKQVEDTAAVTIQLHPDDLELLQKHGSMNFSNAPGSGPLRFVGSSEITRGGCLVQTRFGVIDARRETKLDQLQEAITA